MGHQPFETWILDNEMITDDEQELLREHLSQCPKCSRLLTAWKITEKELHSAKMISPEPGFVNRFQANLITRKAEQHQMQSIKSLLIVAGAILLVFATLIAWLFLTKTPGEMIVGGVSILTGLNTAFINLRSMAIHLFQNVPSYWVYISLILITGWGLILALIWGITIWRFSQKGVVNDENQ